eukprot:g80473.t1
MSLRNLRWEECPASLASGRILLLRLGRTTCRERTPIFAWAKSSIFWTRRLHRSPILIFAYSYYSSATEEVEVSLARPEYFFSFLPPEFEAIIESKHFNPLGELKGDFDDSCPKTGGKFVDRMTRYCQRSHQQTNLLPATSSPSSTLPTSTSSSSTSSISSVVSSLPENSGPSPAINQLQQSLAERARSAHEIAGLKDQLSLMEQKYDTKRSLCAAAVDK